MNPPHAHPHTRIYTGGSATDLAANMVAPPRRQRRLNPMYAPTPERDQLIATALSTQRLTQGVLKAIARAHGVAVGGTKTLILRRLCMVGVDAVGEVVVGGRWGSGCRNCMGEWGVFP